MGKPHNRRPGGSKPPPKYKGKGVSPPSPPSSPSVKSTEAVGNDALIKQVRQIVAETPEIRPEKVGPLKEAVEQGAYEVDSRKVANALIVKLILDP
jgi:flagellar biosynthesis anti-sigma factor FlgM